MGQRLSYATRKDVQTKSLTEVCAYDMGQSNGKGRSVEVKDAQT
jgi:hypothetical protein